MPRPSVIFWATVIAALISVLPIIFISDIPFVDAPNHLARMYILQNINSHSDLARYYYIKSGFYPYNGTPLVIGFLTPFVGLETAGRIFTILAVLMPGLGASTLSYVIHRRLTVLAPAAFAFSMNMLAGWGFLNYLFGLGFAFMVFSVWVMMEAPTDYKRLLIFSVLVGFVGYLHLICGAVILGLIFTYEFSSRNWLRRSAWSYQELIRYCRMMILIVPFLFLNLITNQDLTSSNIIQFGSILRLEAIASPFIMHLDNSWLEMALGISVILIIYAALRDRIIAVHPNFKLMIIVLGLVALLTPVTVSGVYAVHLRLPILVLLLTIAAVDVNPKVTKSRRAKSLAVAFAILIQIHMIACGFVLNQYEKRIAELRLASNVIDRGSRVLPVFNLANDSYQNLGGTKSLWHISSYLVVDRDVFMPTLFQMFEIGVRSTAEKPLHSLSHPLDIRELSRNYSKAASSHSDWLKHYDYIVVFGHEESEPVDCTELLHEGSYFQILRVLRCL